MGKLPTIFVSHGMPAIVNVPGPTHNFLKNLGKTIGTPRAILCVSAHWEAVRPMITGTPRPKTIHDFGGPPALFEELYDVPGAPDMADEILGLLVEAGFSPMIDKTRGLDHGAWVPLKLMYPDARIPVVQLSVQTELNTRHHWDLGHALKPLRKRGVLIIGSGGATHNLPEIGAYKMDSPPPDYALAFDTWLEKAITEGQQESLLRYQKEAPFPNRNHPYPAEHFLPLFVPLGAAGPAARGKAVHKAFMYGVLSLAAYVWD